MLQFQKIFNFSLKIYFVLANSVDPDEMTHNAAFHQGLHCLSMYPFWGFLSSKPWSLFGYDLCFYTVLQTHNAVLSMIELYFKGVATWKTSNTEMQALIKPCKLSQTRSKSDIK